MPALLGWLNQLGLSEQQFGDVLLVMSELLNNALDHGVLGIDSTLKTSTGGFEHYMIERQRKLDALEAGFVEVSMRHEAGVEPATLKISMRDSGRGFDHGALRVDEVSDDAEQVHGRGIVLVRRLCERVTFLGNGNQVEVVYALG